MVGTARVPMAVASAREVRCPREVAFAALPTLFAVHQFIEVLVWLGLDGPGRSRGRVGGLPGVALPILPTWLSASVLLLEPRGARLRVAPFRLLGAVVTNYLADALVSAPVHVIRHPHALQYVTGVRHGGVWAVLYVVAVIGPALMSGYPSIVAFGVLNLVGLVTVALLLIEAFDSLWCVYAALASVLVLVHLRRRRRLPDPHRLAGQGPARLAGTRV